MAFVEKLSFSPSIIIANIRGTTQRPTRGQSRSLL